MIASMSPYRSTPEATSKMPSGIPFIVANEAAERFSFYGMRAVLVVFMTQYLLGAGGGLEPMAEAEARGWFHLFVSAVYFMPLVGALLADVWWGKYRTILWLSLVYCAGHLALSLDQTRLGMALGLTLIAVGAGGIKPCVSAHLGDQFGAANRGHLARAFSRFYFAINLGALAATLSVPWLLDQYGAGVAFAVPGVLMLIATATFWAGRLRFAHLPPARSRFVTALLDRSARPVLARLAVLYLIVAIFWSLFDQTGSAWVLQAEQMDRDLWGWQILPAQIQAANPLLVMVLIPVFSLWVYPALSRRMVLTPVRKISLGLYIAVFAFVLPTIAQWMIDQGATPHVSWQLFAYLLMTAAEVMISITCLEFSYTQAPRFLKSLVMALFMMSIAVGNLFTSMVNYVIHTGGAGTTLDGAGYFLLFTCLMGCAALLFRWVAGWIATGSVETEPSPAHMGD